MEKNFILLNLIFSICILNCNSNSIDWSYKVNGKGSPQLGLNEEKWGEGYKNCDGSKQSPIDIKIKETIYNENFQKINIVKEMNSENNEHHKENDETEYSHNINESPETWEVTGNEKNFYLLPYSHSYSFTLKPEGKYFKLLQMHFHWRGSEHSINGKKYAAELHLVFQQKSNNNQYSVIGFLFEMSQIQNPNLNPILDFIEGHLVNVDVILPKPINNFKLVDLIESLTIEKYFRYSGSLTTPPCDEIVEWIVVDKFLKISDNQLLEMQSIKDVNKLNILTNSRSVQSLNGRVIQRSFDNMNN